MSCVLIHMLVCGDVDTEEEEVGWKKRREGLAVDDADELPGVDEDDACEDIDDEWV